VNSENGVRLGEKIIVSLQEQTAITIVTALETSVAVTQYCKCLKVFLNIIIVRSECYKDSH
jgi:hypothetical protein